MSCDFNLLNHSTVTVDENKLKTCTELICDGEKLVAGEVNLLLCADAEMREYHRIYRGCDSVTDVLSFRTDPGSSETGQQNISCQVNDIVIDTNQIERQKGTNSFEQELLSVFIHGLLHICGYDHIRNKDRDIMQQKENHYYHEMEGE